jgi:transposase
LWKRQAIRRIFGAGDFFWGREEKEHDPQYAARRRVAEVCRSWMNRFRKLPVRYEKKAGNYLGLAEFACAIIVWRNLIPVHPGLIPG